jgi:hypothetical protein
MRAVHIRKKRPTLSDAHAVASGRQNNGITASEYVSDKERFEEAENVVEELRNTVKDHFPKTRNLEYAVLKTHLIVEHTLTQFLRCSLPVLVETENIDFRFSQKITLAYLHGFTDRRLLPSVELLNRARNQVAHHFTLDRKLIDELVRLQSEDYDTFAISTDVERIRGLRYFCNILCGMLVGRLSALIKMSTKVA